MTTNRSPFNLDDVIINSELARRPSRAPDYVAENSALIALAQTMADSPQMILQKLVETTLRLCRADTAGISLLEKHDGAEVLRCEAVAGVYADRVNGTMPRDASPCGTTIDRNATQLMYMAERVFPALTAEPPVVEALLVPFHVNAKPVGTLWIVAHDEGRKFDREDERIIKVLSQFASAAWHLWMSAQTEQRRVVQSAAANEALQLQISERHRAEDQLQQLNSELERRVTDRTRDLITANADVWRTLEEGKQLQEQLRQSQKMESVGTLAGGLAHDFNNLLNIIQGYSLSIMQHTDDPEKIIQDVQVIRETVQQGAALSQQLLTVVRKTDAKSDLTDVNGLLRRLTSLLAETFPRTLTINLEIEPDMPKVMANANLLHQARLNLSVTARDAMAEGGNLCHRTRKVSGAELLARFPDANSERYVCIDVADTGAGIKEEIKSRIFEPFFTTKEPGQGTGLGLSVVYGIVSSQNGFIEVASEVGRGSVFHIYLPIAKEQAALPVTTQPSVGNRKGEGTRHNETLLFVEDEVRQLHLMQRFLEAQGFKVLTARDGAEAVDVHLQHKDEIALVVLDLGLSKLNGWEAFQMMKKLNPKIKGILASGYLTPEVSKMAKGAMSGVIPKPYDPIEILAKIEGAMGRA
jgi:signal transduction histidine kinase